MSREEEKMIKKIKEMVNLEQFKNLEKRDPVLSGHPYSIVEIFMMTERIPIWNQKECICLKFPEEECECIKKNRKNIFTYEEHFVSLFDFVIQGGNKIIKEVLKTLISNGNTGKIIEYDVDGNIECKRTAKKTTCGNMIIKQEFPKNHEYMIDAWAKYDRIEIIKVPLLEEFKEKEISNFTFLGEEFRSKREKPLTDIKQYKGVYLKKEEIPEFCISLRISFSLCGNMWEELQKKNMNRLTYSILSFKSYLVDNIIDELSNNIRTKPISSNFNLRVLLENVIVLKTLLRSDENTRIRYSNWDNYDPKGANSFGWLSSKKGKKIPFTNLIERDENSKRLMEIYNKTCKIVHLSDYNINDDFMKKEIFQTSLEEINQLKEDLILLQRVYLETVKIITKEYNLQCTCF